MSEGELLPVYLLTGGDRPKIRRALARLKARFVDESIETLPETASGEEAVSALNSLGLFAGDAGRLVVVEAVERWKAEDVEAVAAYLTSPAQGSVLALVAGEPLKSSKLQELVARAGGVLAYEAPKPRDLPAWVREQFERLEVTADAEAARALVEIVGNDVTALATEVEKLAAWAEGDPVGRREVELLAAPTAETSAWALTDAWGARDAGVLLAACEAQLEREEKPFVIAARLASYVGRVRAAQALAEEGLGARDVAKRLRVHEFTARKALAHAQNYARDELDDVIVRLAELDAALKGASRLAGELELQRALADLVRRREKAARSPAG
ncbi:MAG: DNA polymerase III subunit delta [Gaiellaceae bacterium]